MSNIDAESRGTTYRQGRINHCAGCTMAGDPDQLPNFYHAVFTFERLNVQCRLKRNDDD